MTKDELRKQVRMLKSRYTAEELREMSRPIIDRLLSHPVVQSAETILLYHSLPDEVYTHEAMRQLCENGKTVMLPKVIGKEMGFVAYTGKLTKGPFGIMEAQSPKSLLKTRPLASPCIIPGIAFDQQGHRLGRGGGYYDRFFQEDTVSTDRHSAKNRQSLIGLCFPFQLFDSIPFEPHDLIVDEVIA